jgi:hypothetical protein
VGRGWRSLVVGSRINGYGRHHAQLAGREPLPLARPQRRLHRHAVRDLRGAPRLRQSVRSRRGDDRHRRGRPAPPSQGPHGPHAAAHARRGGAVRSRAPPVGRYQCLRGRMRGGFSTRILGFCNSVWQGGSVCCVLGHFGVPPRWVLLSCGQFEPFCVGL